jgi:hypothetical protein
MAVRQVRTFGGHHGSWSFAAFWGLVFPALAVTLVPRDFVRSFQFSAKTPRRQDG